MKKAYKKLCRLFIQKGLIDLQTDYEDSKKAVDGLLAQVKSLDYDSPREGVENYYLVFENLFEYDLTNWKQKPLSIKLSKSQYNAVNKIQNRKGIIKKTSDFFKKFAGIKSAEVITAYENPSKSKEIG